MSPGQVDHLGVGYETEGIFGGLRADGTSPRGAKGQEHRECRGKIDRYIGRGRFRFGDEFVWALVFMGKQQSSIILFFR